MVAKEEHYLVLARRFRPQTFREVIGQDAIVKTLKNSIKSKKSSHAYLFSGPKGTGKTTLARIFAKVLNCESLTEDFEPCNVCSSCKGITEGRSLDVIEIDGASHRGIDDIRAISESVSFAPACGKYKIYLVDEVHMLTKEAFNALLKTLEEPPKNVKFFFATTEPHKIPATIISRCQRFNLRRLSPEAIVSKLKLISKELGITVEEKALFRLAKYAEGGARDAESLFDQIITFSDGNVNEEVIEEVLGVVPFEWLKELDQAIAVADYSTAFRISDKVFHDGKDISHFIDDLSEHYRSVLLHKLSLPTLYSHDPEKEDVLKNTAEMMGKEHLFELLDLLCEAQKTLKTAASSKLLLEGLLLNIVRIKRQVPLPYIMKHLFALQEKIASIQTKGEIGSFSFSEEKPLKKDPKHSIPVGQQEEPCPRETASEKKVVLEKVQKVQKVKEEERSSPIETTSKEQEDCRQECLLQFASVELGAPIQKKR